MFQLNSECVIWDISAGSNHSIFLMDHADMKDSKPDVFYVGKHPWLVVKTLVKIFKGTLFFDILKTNLFLGQTYCDSFSVKEKSRKRFLTYKMGMYVPSYVKKKGAYGADQTAKVGAFRTERTVTVVPLELIELGKIRAFRKSGCLLN